MDVRMLEANVEFLNRRMLHPLVLSSGAITEMTEARVSVRVKAGGREATGRGSIYLSDIWAWPSPVLSHSSRDLTLRNLCRDIARGLPAICREPVHPLEMGLRLHHYFCHGAESEVPVLARAMCLSPFDAAIHDAVGIARGASAFALYDDLSPLPVADRYFPGGNASASIQALLRKKPVREVDAWYVVGKNDDLENTVKPWICQRGYRCLKIKTLGRDADEDAQRTAEIYRAARRWGLQNPKLSVDSNEGHSNPQAVLQYLHRLRGIDAEAFAALAYLEQPTNRDIVQHRFDWRKVTELKPVLLDEGLTCLELLDEAKKQGWSGLALKTCKGHSFALVAAAWARDNGMMLALQDLTNPGYAAIHATLFAAFVPTVNGVELNSPQFTPAANAEWMPRLSGLFDPHHGVHEVPFPVPVGLGSAL